MATKSALNIKATTRTMVRAKAKSIAEGRKRQEFGRSMTSLTL